MAAHGQHGLQLPWLPGGSLVPLYPLGTVHFFPVWSEIISCVFSNGLRRYLSTCSTRWDTRTRLTETSGAFLAAVTCLGTRQDLEFIPVIPLVSEGSLVVMPHKDSGSVTSCIGLTEGWGSPNFLIWLSLPLAGAGLLYLEFCPLS